MPDDASQPGSPDDAESRPGGPDESMPDEPTIRTLAAGVAHEFNNVLGGILASAEEALECPDEDDLRRALRTIVNRVDQACVVTANLLSYACQDFIETRSTDLTILLDDCLNVMSERFRLASVSVVRDFAEVPPADVDPPRLERVFLNVLANSVEAMPPTGGRITVELLRQGDSALIRFSDTGSGVPPNVLHRVFEPFVTTKGVFGGGDTPALGLGLSVCQGIVRMHHGSITVSSLPGQGAVVTISIPIKSPVKIRGAQP